MSQAPDDRIDLLCAAVVSTARGVRGRSMFAGWTPDDRPAAATALDGLSEMARRALADYRASGLAPRQVPYSAIVPVTYVVTGAAVDFADHGGRRAEDQVRYTVTDARGERRDIALGERGILGGIVDARIPWQLSDPGGEGAPAVSALPLYTVFAPLPGAAADTGLAMLFEPTIAGASNEPALRSFIRNTVGRLLVLDESQPPRSRKGYLEAAGRLAGRAPRSGSMGTLAWLRRLGMVEFDDNWLKDLDLAKRRAKGRLIGLLRAVGMVDVSDEILDELLHPRPDYDIDELDLDRLFDLSAAMYEVSRQILAPPGR
jgi:hypothetical protein